MLLAAPPHQVLRVLALTRLIDVFAVRVSVDEAARNIGRSQARGCARGRAFRRGRRDMIWAGSWV